MSRLVVGDIFAMRSTPRYIITRIERMRFRWKYVAKPLTPRQEIDRTQPSLIMVTQDEQFREKFEYLGTGKVIREANGGFSQLQPEVGTDLLENLTLADDLIHDFNDQTS